MGEGADERSSRCDLVWLKEAWREITVAEGSQGPRSSKVD